MDVSTAVGLSLAAAFGALGAAKISRTAFMRERAQHVGFSAEQYQLIGVAEVLGALGVLVGFFLTPIGYLAGAGLLLLLVGAVGAHLRAGDRGVQIAPPVLFALGAVGYLVALGAA